jgi:hypothetical protein
MTNIIFKALHERHRELWMWIGISYTQFNHFYTLSRGRDSYAIVECERKERTTCGHNDATDCFRRTTETIMFLSSISPIFNYDQKAWGTIAISFALLLPATVLCAAPVWLKVNTPWRIVYMSIWTLYIVCSFDLHQYCYSRNSLLQYRKSFSKWLPITLESRTFRKRVGQWKKCGQPSCSPTTPSSLL